MIHRFCPSHMSEYLWVELQFSFLSLLMPFCHFLCSVIFSFPSFPFCHFFVHFLSFFVLMLFCHCSCHCSLLSVIVHGPFLSLLQDSGTPSHQTPGTRYLFLHSAQNSKPGPRPSFQVSLNSPLEFSPILSPNCLPGFYSCFSFTFSPIE